MIGTYHLRDAERYALEVTVSRLQYRPVSAAYPALIDEWRRHAEHEGYKPLAQPSLHEAPEDIADPRYVRIRIVGPVE